MIDFDDSSTFPCEIKEWVLNRKEYFYSLFDKKDFSEWWELEHKLCDIRLWEQNFIQQFIEENIKMEVAVWHTTRIEDKESYIKNGIIRVVSETIDKKQKFGTLYRCYIWE